MEMNKLLSNPYNTLPNSYSGLTSGTERLEFEARNFLSKLSNNVANASPEKKISEEVCTLAILIRNSNCCSNTYQRRIPGTDSKPA